MHVHVHGPLCLTLYNSMDYSQQGSSVREIFQARTLEWVAISYSRGSSQIRDRTLVSCVSCIGCRFLVPLDAKVIRDEIQKKMLF